MTAPAIRPSWTKFAVQAINRLPQREAIRRRIGDATLLRIRQSSLLDWLPLEVHLSVVSAVYGVLGEQKARAFWCERLLASFETKLMAPLIGGSTLVFGHPLYACLKMAMYAYRLLVRGAGEIIVQQDKDQPVVSITFTQMPAELVNMPAWHALCYGQCQGAVVYAGAGAAEIVLAERGLTGFTYRIRSSVS